MGSGCEQPASPFVLTILHYCLRSTGSKESFDRRRRAEPKYRAYIGGSYLNTESSVCLCVCGFLNVSRVSGTAHAVIFVTGYLFELFIAYDRPGRPPCTHTVASYQDTNRFARDGGRRRHTA